MEVAIVQECDKIPEKLLEYIRISDKFFFLIKEKRIKKNNENISQFLVKERQVGNKYFEYSLTKVLECFRRGSLAQDYRRILLLAPENIRLEGLQVLTAKEIGIPPFDLLLEEEALIERSEIRGASIYYSSNHTLTLKLYLRGKS